jgi:hypothetical protein
MRTQWASCTLALFCLAASGGCERLMGGGDEGDKAGDDGKATKEGKADEDEKAEEGDDGNAMKVAEDAAAVEGPVPPETSMVFFSVENELMPLGCFDKDKKSVQGGEGCLAMVPEGGEARLASHDSQYTRKVTGRVEPECLAGSGKKAALSVEGAVGGADFLYAAWPQSGIKIVKTIDKETMSPSSLGLGDDEKNKLGAAIKAAGGGSGEVEAHQVAEFDLDGNDKKDKYYAVFIQHPTMQEQYLWSGAFVAPDGNLDSLVLVATSKSKRDVFELRGTLNLDGAGPTELWIRLDFDEGAGDRLFQIDGKKSKPIGEWTCGAGV